MIYKRWNKSTTKNSSFLLNLPIFDNFLEIWFWIVMNSNQILKHMAPKIWTRYTSNLRSLSRTPLWRIIWKRNRRKISSPNWFRLSGFVVKVSMIFTFPRIFPNQAYQSINNAIDYFRTILNKIVTSPIINWRCLNYKTDFIRSSKSPEASSCGFQFGS